MAQKIAKRALVLVCLIVLALFYVVIRSSLSQKGGAMDSTPLTMILTTELKMEPYLQKVIANREEYAARHGYRFVVRNLETREAQEPKGWARLLAFREVLEEFPNSEWYWFLGSDAIIMDPEIAITDDILNPSVLETLMLRDVPIIPPDSVIKTLKSTSAESAQLVISHDHAGMNTQSFVLRNGEFAKFFLESWTQPLYQSYGFERQETSALEHIIQWHYTIMSSAALIPKRLLASYAGAADDMAYKEGDFVVMFDGCDNQGRSCLREFERYWTTRGRTSEGLAKDEHAKNFLSADSKP